MDERRIIAMICNVRKLGLTVFSPDIYTFLYSNSVLHEWSSHGSVSLSVADTTALCLFVHETCRMCPDSMIPRLTKSRCSSINARPFFFPSLCVGFAQTPSSGSVLWRKSRCLTHMAAVCSMLSSLPTPSFLPQICACSTPPTTIRHTVTITVTGGCSLRLHLLPFFFLFCFAACPSHSTIPPAYLPVSLLFSPLFLCQPGFTSILSIQLHVH